MNPHRLSSDSGCYVTALVGNGEIVTTVGPTGYHTGGDWHPALEIVVWSGRRLHERVPGLIRMGCFRRRLQLDGEPVHLEKWEQEVSPMEGLVRSRVFHEGLTEDTTTFVVLDRNFLVVATDLINTGGTPRRVDFEFDYVFGDDRGHVPLDSVVRPKPARNGGDIYFEVADDIGCIGMRLLREMETESLAGGLRFHQTLEIPSGGAERLGFLIGYSDRRKYLAVPDEWKYESLLSAHQESWRSFQDTSTIDLALPEIEALRRNCLYSIRCNCTPWSIPPAVLPTHWEGRTFHDELYPFLALLSGGHRELAVRVPRFRLKTLSKAVAYGGFRGARYPWETTEEGREGGSYGDWMDEHFHIGQFAETAWQLCLYEKDTETETEYFPLFRECADYFLDNLLQEVNGRLQIRPCTDYDEAMSPVPNGIYTACAAIRCLEIAAEVAGKRGTMSRRRKSWLESARRLRESLPKSATEDRYLTFDKAPHHHIAELGPVFPFRIDTGSRCARNTVEAFSQACRSDVGWTAGSLPGYRESRWMWSGAHLATAWALLGDGNRALETLIETAKTAGPGLSPCEQTHPNRTEVNCPWFTTAAGAYTYALHSLCLQVDARGTWLFPALPKSLPEVSFTGLAGMGTGTRISAEIRKGKLRRLRVHTDEPREVLLHIPSKFLPSGFKDWEPVMNLEDKGTWSSVVLGTSGPS